MKPNKPLLADLGLIYASAIWGTTFFVVKDILKNIDPVILCAYRFLIAGLIILPYLLLKRKSIFAHWGQGFILGIALWGIYLSQTIGLLYTTASNAAFITGLFVAFVPLFAFIFLRKSPSLVNLLAVLFSISGLWILTGGLKEINKGDLITLITAISYAMHIILADIYIKNKLDPYILTFQQFITVALLSFITAFIFQLPHSISSSKVIWIMSYLIFFPTVIAFLIQLLAQRLTAPLRVSLIFALEPVFGAIFAWTFGGEAFISSRAIGGLFIFIAIIVSSFSLDLAFPMILKRRSSL